MVRLAVGADKHLVWVFLAPLQGALRAVHFYPDVVFAAVANLRCRHRAERAVFVADHGGAIVIQFAAGLESLERAGDLVREQS